MIYTLAYFYVNLKKTRSFDFINQNGTCITKSSIGGTANIRSITQQRLIGWLSVLVLPTAIWMTLSVLEQFDRSTAFTVLWRIGRFSNISKDTKPRPNHSIAEHQPPNDPCPNFFCNTRTIFVVYMYRTKSLEVTTTSQQQHRTRMYNPHHAFSSITPFSVFSTTLLYFIMTVNCQYMSGTRYSGFRITVQTSDY